MLLLIGAYFLIFIGLFFSVLFLTDRALRSRGYRGPISDHFNGTVFLNYKREGDVFERAGLASVLKWLLSREQNVWERRSVTQTTPLSHVEGAQLRVTMINHASVLIQTDGLNIITDPIYARRASPFSFVGPHRFTEPGVAFDDLPPIDVIVISHNHYDHLDLTTLRRLIERDNPRLFVPLGNQEFLERRGIRTSTELDWWQTETISPSVTIRAVAGQHFSSRALSDRNNTLWCGYVISTSAGDIYFAGDTGYGPFVQEIALRYPNGFRFGLLPIGAFRPEWFMKEVHISPDEAFRIQQELNIQKAMGIHFGTFKLADDKQDEPVLRVEELHNARGSTPTFLTLLNGESIEV